LIGVTPLSKLCHLVRSSAARPPHAASTAAVGHHFDVAPGLRACLVAARTGALFKLIVLIAAYISNPFSSPTKPVFVAVDLSSHWSRAS